MGILDRMRNFRNRRPKSKDTTTTPPLEIEVVKKTSNDRKRRAKACNNNMSAPKRRSKETNNEYISHSMFGFGWLLTCFGDTSPLSRTVSMNDLNTLLVVTTVTFGSSSSQDDGNDDDDDTDDDTQPSMSRVNQVLSVPLNDNIKADDISDITSLQSEDTSYSSGSSRKIYHSRGRKRKSQLL